jgi:FKBP-type peptidyl-prolyl cis-trans isomerase
LAIVGQAIKDVKDNKAKMTGQEALAFVQTFQQKEYERQMRQSVTPEALEQHEKNKKAGEDYLAENKGKAGVITLPSGLQYKIIQEGTGPKPKETDVVEVHYRGTLIDGTEFDSSYSRGKTETFPLNGVIRGWTEGLQHVNEGSKVIFYIPQELAYGATPRPGGPIEPYMALIFEIELIKVQAQN